MSATKAREPARVLTWTSAQFRRTIAMQAHRASTQLDLSCAHVALDIKVPGFRAPIPTSALFKPTIATPMPLASTRSVHFSANATPFFWDRAFSAIQTSVFSERTIAISTLSARTRQDLFNARAVVDTTETD